MVICDECGAEYEKDDVTKSACGDLCRDCVRDHLDVCTYCWGRFAYEAWMDWADRQRDEARLYG